MAQKSLFTLAASNIRDEIVNNVNLVCQDWQKKLCYGRANPGSRLINLIMEFEDDTTRSFASKTKEVMRVISSIRSQCTKPQIALLLGRGSLEPIKKLCIFYGAESLFDFLCALNTLFHDKPDDELCPEFTIGEWIVACIGMRINQRSIDQMVLTRTKNIFFRLLKLDPWLFVTIPQNYTNSLYIAMACGIWDIAKVLLNTENAVSDGCINTRVAPEDPNSPMPEGLTSVEIFLCTPGNNETEIMKTILGHRLFRISSHRIVRFISIRHLDWLAMVVKHKDFLEMTCWSPADKECNHSFKNIIINGSKNDSETIIDIINTLISKGFLFISTGCTEWLPALLLLSRSLFLRILKINPYINVLSEITISQTKFDSMGVLCMIALYGDKDRCRKTFFMNSELYTVTEKDSGVQVWLDCFREELVAILTHSSFEFQPIYYGSLYNVIIPLAKEIVPEKFPSSIFTKYIEENVKENKLLFRRNTEFMDGVIKQMIEEPDHPPVSPNLPVLRYDSDDGLSLLQSKKRKHTEK